MFCFQVDDRYYMVLQPHLNHIFLDNTIRVLFPNDLDCCLNEISLNVTTKWIPFGVVRNVAQQKCKLISHDIVSWR